MKKVFEKQPVESFVPSNYEESRCKEIATELQEPHMNYLLSVLKRRGFSVVERAWGYYKEAKETGQPINNPPAYFNWIIANLTQ